MTGRTGEADSLFRAILNADPLFSLDPIRTSPKIYEVYFSAKSAWQQGRPPTLPSAPPNPPAPPAGPPAYRYGLYVCPFAAGQFYNRDRGKGLLFLALQAVSAGAVIFLYQKRQGLYDPDYGWYRSNQAENRSYMNGVRVSFGLFVSAYFVSVADAFRTDLKRRAP